MSQPATFEEAEFEPYPDLFMVLTTSELFAMGFIDESVMNELFAPWESDFEMSLAA